MERKEPVEFKEKFVARFYENERAPKNYWHILNLNTLNMYGPRASS